MKHDSKIKSLLVLKGIKSVDISRAAKCSTGAVSMTISGQRASLSVRRVIARKLKMPIAVLWPDNKP
jgi:lambda repressor-like predicted transcriptional regulator